MKRILFITTISALWLTACGAQTPTVDPAQIQASAVAAANTMVALTQAAIPTATPIPPTPLPSPTLLPSPTPLPLPTLSIGASPTIPASSSSNTSGDPCNASLPPDPDGPKAKAVVIVNKSGAQTNGSIYLSKTDFGQCGYRGFSLDKGGSQSYTDLPLGCYSLFAWINDPKKPTMVSGGACITGPDKTTFTITTTTVTAKGP